LWVCITRHNRPISAPLKPLEGKKLTPPAGPVPQNPPFNGGSRINPRSWVAGPRGGRRRRAPTLPRNLTRLGAGLGSACPQYRATKYPGAWTPPAFTPIVAINLDPPLLDQA